MNKTLRSVAVAVLIGGAALGMGSAATANAEELGLYGDPDTAALYWSEQNYDDCAIMASAHVVGILTGDMPDEDDIVAVAERTASRHHSGPIYVLPADLDNPDPDTGGTNARDLPVLLAQYGIHATYTDDDAAADGGLETGIAALEQYLGGGRAVIASVNANTIWQQPEDGDGAHALVVTGIDTENDIVHLNDSGTDDGADEQVGIATFLSAWSDMDQRMVVTS